MRNSSVFFVLIFCVDFRYTKRGFFFFFALYALLYNYRMRVVRHVECVIWLSRHPSHPKIQVVFNELEAIQRIQSKLRSMLGISHAFWYIWNILYGIAPLFVHV